MRASELEHFHNYIHLSMQLLTITNNNHDLLFTTVPHQGQNKDSRGQDKCPKGDSFPTLCLLFKFAFRD